MASPRTTYTRERTDKVLGSLASGLTLAKSCKEHGVVLMTFYDWLERDFDDLKKRYEQAKISHMECLSEKLAETIEAPLSDEEKEYPIAFKRRELQMKRLQWELEKRHRNVYGNHMTVEQKHTIDLKPLLDRVRESIRDKGLKPVEAIHKSTEKPL
ncbi:terminase small subunit-like protein, partial [Candidatus Liberibacter solanacearum]|uniref:terminase small subunit-like protein n=2 Tax=Candidatus Liberibacter solanacearum TaxID=556287 RepID=UPI00387DD33D